MSLELFTQLILPTFAALLFSLTVYESWSWLFEWPVTFFHLCCSFVRFLWRKLHSVAISYQSFGPFILNLSEVKRFCFCRIPLFDFECWFSFAGIWSFVFMKLLNLVWAHHEGSIIWGNSWNFCFSPCQMICWCFLPIFGSFNNCCVMCFDCSRFNLFL